MRQKLLDAAYRMSCRSRQMKFDLFWREIAPRPGSTVLNLGGDPPIMGALQYGGGNAAGVEQPEQDERFRSLRMVACNLLWQNMRDYRAHYRSRGWSALVGDGCRLPFADQSIDVIFSNAVIEHLPREQQAQMASEIMRVGRSWFVSTPNFWFPMELHRRIPCFQLLPQSVQRACDRRFGLIPDGEVINLLSARDMRRLFPAARVVHQRVTFFPEILIAYRRGENRNQVPAAELELAVSAGAKQALYSGSNAESGFTE